MIKLRYILVFFITTNVLGQLNPQTKSVTKKYFPDFEEVKNVTPALQKKKGFTNDKELYAFIEDLAKNHPNKVNISYIGESQKGKKIPFVRMTNPNEKEKIKVFFQGGLHGNEMASTEGVLYVMHQLLNDENYIHLLDDVDLAVIPMANIDGYLKKDRYAANGLDLNRDQTKLMAKESVILKQAFSDFVPEVAVDFHEYTAYRRDFAKMGSFGIANAFDVMFLFSGNLNIPKNLREFTHQKFVKNASKVLDENGLRNHPYISTRKIKGDIHFNQGSISARSSATNYALSNAVSSLIEIRGVNLGRTSFKRRIQSLFLVATSYLKTAIENKKELKEAIAKAIITQKDIVVTSKRKVYKGKLPMLDLDTEEIIEIEVVKRDAWLATPNLTRATPKGYLIDASEKEIIKKLQILGVKVDELNDEEEFEVEHYKIEDYKRNSKKYEQMNLQKVGTNIQTQKKMFPKGTFKVYLNQKNANMVVEVLEPEAPNSFVTFGLIKTKKGATLPIYRILK